MSICVNIVASVENSSTALLQSERKKPTLLSRHSDYMGNSVSVTDREVEAIRTRLCLSFCVEAIISTGVDSYFQT